ncbi:hypothetical protein FGM00_11315 [Aggregatimonas sangjinii]|uniref:Uncharacterized protein n=1 Tax=Aggregatimonas sangjinii TaxID=2583587 RepID=A0A5B7SQ02_9FLAO|nr:hypothetical protein [Aggregatimonas sangjinii]QCX00666.1 hypothetical protein FGM00_11315 [Aggregatimonas sangjinii]
MKKYVTVLLLSISTMVIGQSYYDVPKKLVTDLTVKVYTLLEEEVAKTNDEFNKALPAAMMERLSLINLERPPQLIDWNEYGGICKYFLNPIKIANCKRKKAFLEESEAVIYDFLMSAANNSNKMNSGVQEQIYQKYVSMINRILLELDAMQILANRRDIFHNFKN